MRHQFGFLLATGFLGAVLLAACMDDGPSPSSTSTSTSGGGNHTSTSSGGGEGGEGGGIGGEGGGVGGGGGAGGGMLTGADTCPGDAYDVALGSSLVLKGTTVGQADDYKSYCGVGSGSGADVVYAITPLESGTMTVSLLENTNGLNGVIYAQESCGDPSLASFINCKDDGDGAETFSFNAEQGVVYYMFVDGRDGTEGDYSLEVALNTGVCGDGVINPMTEDCDFGDVNPGDGCDQNCQFEAPADNSDTCPGQVLQISPGMMTTIDSYTTGYTDNYTSCGAAMGSPDRVFALFPTADGNVTVTLPNLGVAGGGFDGVLAAWQATCSPGVLTMPPYVGCSDGANASDTETMSFPVTSGVLTFVVVDGYADYSYGNFSLTIEMN